VPEVSSKLDAFRVSQAPNLDGSLAESRALCSQAKEHPNRGERSSEPRRHRAGGAAATEDCVPASSYHSTANKLQKK